MQSGIDRLRPEAGFTLIEIMMTVMLIGVLGAMAIFQVGSIRPGLQGDGAMRAVMSELNTARDLAISQRRYMLVTFVGDNQLRITRQEVPTGTTVLRDISFEAGMEYELISGIADTPDAFGNSSPAYFGSATTIRFNTDGTLIDQAGATINGTVFLAQPGVPLSFRAVTVQGSTGRVRAYKWVGNQWARV